MAHTHCVLDKQGYMLAHTRTRPCTHACTHICNMYCLFHGNNVRERASVLRYTYIACFFFFSDGFLEEVGAPCSYLRVDCPLSKHRFPVLNRAISPWIVYFRERQNDSLKWFHGRSLCPNLRDACVIVLSAFAELRKATIRFVMSIRPSEWNKSSPVGRFVMKFDVWLFFFENLSRKFNLY
jgi:hypothetical protein